MDTSPKLNKRSSLSLKNCRSNRNSYVFPYIASPQNNFHHKKKISNADALPSSPVMPTQSCSAECFTPTHKIMSLDDTLDSTQKALDTSFSPNSLLSQTLPTESPEVGWRWARQKSDFIKNDSADDNASAITDSPCATNKSSNKRKLINSRREQYRKAIEFDIHRAEKSRAKQVLQIRYTKLLEQLKEAKLPKVLEVNSRSETVSITSTDITCFDNSIEKLTENTTTKINTSLSDFFNDSDSDGFLLEATQQIESKIHFEAPLIVNNSEDHNSSCAETSDSTLEAANTSTSTSNEKCSSLYMKFLEDDSPDDWFTSLDDVIEQAMQAKKPRNFLQRYKSMPAEATSVTIAQNTTNHVRSTKVFPTTVPDSNFGISRKALNENKTVTTDKTKFKRYASSNTIPSSSR